MSKELTKVHLSDKSAYATFDKPAQAGFAVSEAYIRREWLPRLKSLLPGLEDIRHMQMETLSIPGMGEVAIPQIVLIFNPTDADPADSRIFEPNPMCKTVAPKLTRETVTKTKNITAALGIGQKRMCAPSNDYSAHRLSEHGLAVIPTLIDSRYFNHPMIQQEIAGKEPNKRFITEQTLAALGIIMNIEDPVQTTYGTLMGNYGATVVKYAVKLSLPKVLETFLEYPREFVTDPNGNAISVENLAMTVVQYPNRSNGEALYMITMTGYTLGMELAYEEQLLANRQTGGMIPNTFKVAAFNPGPRGTM